MFGLDNALWDTIRDPAKGYLNDLASAECVISRTALAQMVRGNHAP